MTGFLRPNASIAPASAIQFSISCCPEYSISSSVRLRQVPQSPRQIASNRKRSPSWSGQREPCFGDRKQCDQLEDATSATRYGDFANTSAIPAPTSIQRRGCAEGGSPDSPSGRGGP